MGSDFIRIFLGLVNFFPIPFQILSETHFAKCPATPFRIVRSFDRDGKYAIKKGKF
jgi:hypothetical protein